MENLLKKLQDEAGLTEEQAVKTLSIVKDFMDKEDLNIDWEKFFKSKYENLSGQAKSFFDVLSEKASQYSNKLGDKVEDLASQAKHATKDLTQKASDYLDDDNKK